MTEKSYKFEILQHTLTSFEFSNFSSRELSVRQMKYLSTQRSFYLEQVGNN